MAIIKKYGTVYNQPLSAYATFILDTEPNSKYFKITEFKDVFTGGKNGFLIEGSKHLMQTTEIKVQVLDVAGNPLYVEYGNGIPEYYEGTSKIVAVYVYDDTPIGEATITILGELKTYEDSGGVTLDIPDDWKGNYNIKWNKTFSLNKLLINEDKIRFYRRPQVSITEIVKPIFSNVVAPKTQSGIVNGQALTPRLGEQLTNYTQPTEYLLTTVGNTFWTASVVGTYLNIPGIEYSPLVTEVINSREILVNPPYSNTALGSAAPVENFTNEAFTAAFNYTEGVDNLKTALTGSFAKITLSDLTTFVGDCARVKIFRKSTADLSDFQFVQEIQLESNELLVDLESTTKNQENYGLFDNINFKSEYPTGYWITSSNNLKTIFNQTFLYNSVKLDNIIGVEKFFTSKSFNINEGIEYSLNFNVKKEAVGNASNYIEAYLSGSKQTTINGSPTTVQVKQSIVTLKTQNSLLQKQNITKNIKAEKIDNAKLYFDVKGSDWYIADISLKASQETAFSPDEITFIQSVPRNLPAETFVYRFEFYDINNNYIPVLVEETKTFDGGNLQTIRKQLRLIASSAGFQFDSGSNPVPTGSVITIEEEKTLLTGSVHYTSASFDFFGNLLTSSQYTQSIYEQPIPLYSGSGQYPGVLQGIGTNNVFMRVQDFTGSRTDINVQLVKITGECEGFTDTINIYKILDGFGGVNHIIRPYRGTQIRNSSTASLEIQAVRIDGINDIILSKQSYKNFFDIQLHVLSRSLNYESTLGTAYEEPDKFVNLSNASSSKYIYGLTSGSLGSGEINYNAVFNRDSIDFRRIIYLIPSSSNVGKFAYEVSSSVLASIILEDLQDGLDSGKVLFNVDTFTINPRTQTTFTPITGSATASFAKRGTAPGEIESVTSSFQVYPSMSINKDWVPEYWMYYTTQSCNPTITVVARDENKNIIDSLPSDSYIGQSNKQSKNLTLTFVYTEPWTSASVSIDKTFTIVPEGKQGDESIVFEVNPIAITLGANSRGVVNDFKPSITDIKLKQGARYLAFSSSAYTPNNLNTHGTFYLSNVTFPTASIIEKNVKAGNLQLTSSFGIPYTSSLIISASSELRDLSGSVEYMLVVHPYFTSSIYTASVVVNYTKVLEGPPPIQILISPISPSLIADEVGYITPLAFSSSTATTIQVKEGDDFLKLITTESFANADARKGTYTINSIQTSKVGNNWNIVTGSLASSSKSGLTGTINYHTFEHPYVSASALYTIQVYPFALGAGHQPTSSIFTRTQTFTKNITPPKARSVDFKASAYTINYDRNGRVSPASQGGIELSATAFNTTASANNVSFYLFDEDDALIEQQSGSGTPPSYIFLGSPVNYNDVGPNVVKRFTVKISDGNAYQSPTIDPYRAEAQLTISGIKAGADSYKLVSTNDNCSIAADLWTTTLTGTGMKLTTFNGTQQLTNVGVANFPAPNNPDDYDFEFNPIGVLGFSSASIFSKSAWITMADTKFPNTNPAEIGNITGWLNPATNTSGQIVYRVDFEGGKWPSTTPAPRQTQFVTQSIAVQFTPPAPYDVKMTNESTSVVYKVAGSLSFDGTGTIIKAFRGDTELVNTNPLPATDTDAYGTTGLSKDKCRITILSKSGHITLGGGLISGSHVTGTPATAPNIISWTSPATNPTAEIVYRIQFEGRQNLVKTQSISIQYEGSVGPGLVMRGEWDATKDYYGSVENINDRLDVVTYQATQDDTKYYAAISGSGPNTWVNPTTSTFYRGASPPAGFTFNVLDQAPTPATTQLPPVAYWRYLGTQDFFVAAKLAIFEKSFVKNSINVGTKPGALDDFANIVINGGRTDPYIAMGQVGSTAGTAGTSGTSITGTGIIGYDRPGIFLGIYENGSSGTSGRFSIKTTSTSGKGMFWDGDTLTIVGAIKQYSPGNNEGRIMGAWASGVSYLTNDIVTYTGNTWSSNTNHVSTNDTNVSTGYPGSGPWTIAPIASSTLSLMASSFVFAEAKDGTLSPNYIELQANKQNISATTNWTATPSVTFYDAASGGSTTTSGNIVYLRKADYGANTLVKVTATAGSYSDTVSIARIIEGSDALTVILDNEAHTLPTTTAGTVTYTNSGTNIYIYEGATQILYDGVGTTAGTWTVVATGTSVTPGAITDGGAFAIVAQSSAMSADLASVSFAITGKKINGASFSITKIQSLSKSKQGATGAGGDTGPGVVYRGNYNAATAYFHITGVSARRDVVRYPANTGTYYLTNNTAKNGLTTWGTPGVADWDTFGATFSSVATDILLAQDATITNGLVIGTDGLTNGFIRSTGASTLDTGSAAGFYLQQDGRFRFGNNPDDIHYEPGSKPSYISWDNTTLTIKGKIETDSTPGSISKIGDWEVVGGVLQASSSAGQISLNPNIPNIKFKNAFNSEKLIITNGVIPDPGGVAGTLYITIPAVSIPSFGAYSTGVEHFFDSSGPSNIVISGSQAGDYTGTPDFSAFTGQAYSYGATFYGRVKIYVWAVIRNPAGAAINQIVIADLDDYYYGFGAGAKNYVGTNYLQSLSFPTNGTYTIETYYDIYYDIVDDSVTNDAQTSPVVSGAVFSQALDLSMLTDEGLLIATGTTRYLKIDRNNAATYILDVKGNARFEPTKLLTEAGISALNGYTYLTNGVILQWGYVTGTAVPTTVTFPLTFPTLCRSVSVTTDRNSSGANGYNHAYNVSTTGFSAVMDANYDGWFIAIGN